MRVVCFVLVACMYMYMCLTFTAAVQAPSKHHPHSHHHHHHKPQILTWRFLDDQYNLIGHITATPGICVLNPGIITYQIGSFMFQVKNTTDQWGVMFYKDQACTKEYYAMQGYGVGGVEWGPDFQMALVSAPITTKYTASWAFQDSYPVPFMVGIVNGECEQYFYQANVTSMSWKYNVVEANNTWQYYEYENADCEDPPHYSDNGVIGWSLPTNTVVSLTNDYTCSSTQFGSCPPNEYCGAQAPGWACMTA